ncbi:MAG: hypothetical protein ACXWPM_12995, partial [Bdellovibrionota bacterium]
MSSALSFRKVSTILAILIGITFYSSIDGAFHFDDTHSIESNVAIRSMANIPSFWSDPRTSSFIPENRVYRPMVYTLYSVCWWIGQGSTHPFHVMKLLMHLSVCLALFLIWRRLWSEPGWFPEKIPELHIPFVSRTFRLTPEWAALFLAMLFSVHPATSECVDYIAATTSLQCAMFYLWAYVAYLKLRESAQLKFLAISMGLYFLSVASKEEGITLPAMIVLTELFLSRGTVVARL